MRILYFADIRFPLERANGIQTMETCHALAVRGHRVTLVVRPDTHQPARDPLAYYSLPHVTSLTIARAPVAGPAAARRIAYLGFSSALACGRSRGDVVLTRDLGLASLLLRTPRAWRPPIVYESHGYAPDVAAALPDLVSTAGAATSRKLSRLTRREARVWKRADGYVTITAGLQSRLTERHGPRANVAVVPDGARVPVSTAPPPYVPRGAASGYTVAYAGHLYRWKGVDVLIDALALVPEARGVIVGGLAGETDLEHLRARAASRGVADRVTFTGWVEPAGVPALLEGADAVALPNPASAISTAFTSPLKLFEYMAAGRAIVASDLPAIREVLEDGVHALLVAPGDAGALAAGIRRLMNDPGLAKRLAGAAFDAVQQYSWERRAERLERLLAAVASGALKR